MTKFAALRNYLRRLLRNETGAALVEYGMLVGLIAVICIGAVQALGLEVQAAFQAIVDALNIGGGGGGGGTPTP